MLRTYHIFSQFFDLSNRRQDCILQVDLAQVTKEEVKHHSRGDAALAKQIIGDFYPKLVRSGFDNSKV